ncbi:MAG: MBOAT family protein [Ruminococcaceae bacterium]|nr:MBOAT family protein [Oscillospiraceae bacterium]
MVFSSLLFMFIYLPVVLAVYYFVPRRWRNLWLLIVNLVFYGWGEPVYILLMLFSICINYFTGIFVEKYAETDKRRAKRILVIDIVVNLLLLGFFKYFDLFAETLSMLPGVRIPSLGLELPIGISFYTFQTMSYPIDVYRGDAKAERNPVSFGTFVALFPQLIAGPIVRYKDVADQLNFRAGSLEQFSSGVRRFIVGLGKKVLIANNIGLLWDVYKNVAPGSLTVLGAWLGILAFTLQIYFDFSGYSDMAIGLGRLLGFEFLENFNYPYISKSVTEFWRRWHISLGTWFRDYVYIPLGGNRCGRGRQFFNLLVVWALTGFWHGANWTFLCWGLYYALFLMIEKAFLLRHLKKAPVPATVYALLVAVCGWVLFDLPTLGGALAYYKAMFGFSGAGLCSAADLYHLRSFALMFIVAAVAALPLGKSLYDRLPARVKAVATPVMILAVLVLSTAYLVDATYNPFLYFRF